MAKVVVGNVVGFEPELPADPEEFLLQSGTPLRVNFEDGQSAELDSNAPESSTFTSVLRQLYQASVPVYVELDDAGRIISDVQIPVTERIQDLSRTPGGDLNISLLGSSARFLLKRANPRFGDFAAILAEAIARNQAVSLTEHHNSKEIIDIRPAPNPPEPASLMTFFEASAAGANALQQMTLLEATDLFKLASRQSCDPETEIPPCIPFLYPRRGCQGRAAAMCQLFSDQGQQAGKVWNFGDLVASTPNEPDCEATWSFHVAPLVLVDSQNDGNPEPFVIDPSLFQRPVPLNSWVAVQGDTAALQVITSAVPFVPRTTKPNGGFVNDPNGRLMLTVLSECRAALRRRCRPDAPPPPPYPRCQPRRD